MSRVTRQESLETPASISLTALRDPVIEAHGHRPGSPYVEAVWLGVLGPSTILAWQRLARAASHSSPTLVDATDLAVSLGLGEGLGRNSQISRTLGRLVSFGAATRYGDTMAVRLALPDVPERFTGRLSYSAQLSHQRLAYSHQRRSALGEAAVARMEAIAQ